MQYFIHTFLRIYSSLGFFAYVLIFLQLAALTRTIMLIIQYKRLKAKNEADKKVKTLLICYCILTALLWLPPIIISLVTTIKVKTR